MSGDRNKKKKREEKEDEGGRGGEEEERKKEKKEQKKHVLSALNQSLSSPRNTLDSYSLPFDAHPRTTEV